MKIIKLSGSDKKLYYVKVMKKTDESLPCDVQNYNDHICEKAPNFM